MNDVLKMLLAINTFDDYDYVLKVYDGIPEEYLFDEELNDCVFYMSIFMLSSEGEKHEEYYKEFCERYESLNEERQLMVQTIYKNIIKAQDENEKNKIKKKGNDKYE